MMIALASMLFMMVNMKDLGILFDIGFILGLLVYGLNLMISKAMLAKICHHQIRGTMFALSGIADSIAVAFSSWVGGYLYRDASRFSPLIISACIYTFTCLYTIYYAYKGKLQT